MEIKYNKYSKESWKWIKKHPDFPFYFLPLYAFFRESITDVVKKGKVNREKSGALFAYGLTGLWKVPAIAATIIAASNSCENEEKNNTEYAKINKNQKNIEQKVSEESNFSVDKTFFYPIYKTNRKVYKE